MKKTLLHICAAILACVLALPAQAAYVFWRENYNPIGPVNQKPIMLTTNARDTTNPLIDLLKQCFEKYGEAACRNGRIGYDFGTKKYLVIAKSCPSLQGQHFEMIAWNSVLEKATTLAFSECEKRMGTGNCQFPTRAIKDDESGGDPIYVDVIRPDGQKSCGE